MSEQKQEKKRTCNECRKNNGCWTRGFFLDPFSAWKYCGEFVEGECAYPPEEPKREKRVIDTMVSSDSRVSEQVYCDIWQEKNS